MAEPQKLPKVALIYDFDDTLIKGNMQEYGFIEGLGYQNNEEFWNKVEKETVKEGKDGFKDRILTYMYLMVNELREKKHQHLTKNDLHALGAHIRFCPGVDTWAASLRKEWTDKLDIRHYVASSGIKEIILGTDIETHFEDKKDPEKNIQIYASEFYYNPNGEAIWPARIFNFTTKTQVLFLINKGLKDADKINRYKEDHKREVPFGRMIYYGDGDTDVPCMRLVKSQGGHAFAVYTNKEKETGCKRLVQENRVHWALEADYNPGSALYETTHKVLAKIHADWAVSQCVQAKP